MDKRKFRTAGWLAVAGLVGAALVAPATASAAAPGGDDNLPNSGDTSNTGGVGVEMGTATMTCDDGSVLGVSGSFSLSGTAGAGTYVVIYLTPNGGSDASPAGNVENNQVKVDISGKSGTVNFSVPITSPFTTTKGGILAVFAKDVDGSVFTSKSNSLNCTEAVPTPTPTVAPTPTPTVAPTPTPTVAPTPTPTVAPTPTPTVAPTPTPTAPPEVSLQSVPCTGDQSPRIRIIGFILGLHVFVNGVDRTADLSGDDVAVPAGTYHVEVRDSEGHELLDIAEFVVAPCTQAEPTPTPTVAPTPTPTVVAATPTPKVTPPPTDTSLNGGSNGSNSLPIVFLALAGILATTLILTPRKRRNR